MSKKQSLFLGKDVLKTRNKHFKTLETNMKQVVAKKKNIKTQTENSRILRKYQQTKLCHWLTYSDLLGCFTEYNSKEDNLNFIMAFPSKHVLQTLNLKSVLISATDDDKHPGVIFSYGEKPYCTRT
eukprot:UN33623